MTRHKGALERYERASFKVKGRSNQEARKECSLNVVGLFAGIGGFELGLKRAGHKIRMLCEKDPAASAVLKARFPGITVAEDVRKMDRLPGDIDLLASGFPCQDLSPCGETKGINGKHSGLVSHVFRL